MRRRGARVLLIDSAGRVLMFRGHDPAQPGRRYWFTAGGGIDDGETARDGAIRELYEETGLRADPADLVGPVHEEVIDFPYDGTWYRQAQVFFLLRVDTWTVDTSRFEPVEKASIDSWRWWSAAELRAADEAWYPAELADLLDRLAENRT